MSPLFLEAVFFPPFFSRRYEGWNYSPFLFTVRIVSRFSPSVEGVLIFPLSPVGRRYAGTIFPPFLEDGWRVFCVKVLCGAPLPIANGTGSLSFFSVGQPKPRFWSFPFPLWSGKGYCPLAKQGAISSPSPTFRSDGVPPPFFFHFRDSGWFRFYNNFPPSRLSFLLLLFFLYLSYRPLWI